LPVKGQTNGQTNERRRENTFYKAHTHKNNHNAGLSFSIKTLALAVASCLPVTATLAQSPDSERVSIEELVIIGSRSNRARTVADSPVPVDVFSAKAFNAVGSGADITDNLNALVPSYIATPATGDGSAFVRPTSLRGMASDQTLVLVNGNRRHRSALVQLFAPAANNGSHGVDVGMIPGLALKSVEILRDGAAAQYGSDAIAGVISFQLNDAAEGGSIETSYGEFFEGESSWQVGINKGFAIGDTGFVNLTLHTNDNEALSRGQQRADAQTLINNGVAGVGADAVFGDAPYVQSWGRPETSGTRFVFNSGVDISDNIHLYGFGNYAESEGRYRFFYRNNQNADLTESLTKGATNLTNAQAVGYTPYLDGKQSDYSAVLGLKGVMANTDYDVSVGMGSNELDYTLHNSLNGDAALVGGQAVRDFNTGDYAQEELSVNIDLGTSLNDSIYLSYGFEYREETFKQYAGDRAAYIGGGVSGLAGTRPGDAGEYSRDNYAVYADLEQDISDRWLLQYALRYEDFSDFGGTLNGKLATRYSLTDNTALRTSVSTGFHAPTPGQANLRSTTTTLDNANNIVEVGHLPAGSAEAALWGGKALTEEKAVNLSVGISSDLTDSTTLTVDAYLIQVSDRIYRADIDTDADGKNDTSFYTNAMDIDHSGIDVVLVQDYALMDQYDSNLVFAYSYGKVSVDENRMINGRQVVSDDLLEDIENNYPNHKFTLTNNIAFGDAWSLMARARYLGKHYDERGNIAGTSGAGQSQQIDPVLYVDMELAYSLNESFTISLGGSNIFDKYPDRIENTPGVANRIGVGLPYPRRSAANYEGGSWYLKAKYDF